jgi:hypothetical protein
MKRDPRWQVYARRDGWGEATLVHPDPEQPGWICPGCGETVTVFYGHGPEFRDGRYIPGTDTRLCAGCHTA